MPPTAVVNIEQEMQQSYLGYAMSVIVGRALPDARDGLKPVHRRTLYAMNELGLGPTSPYKKSARVVGDVIGKYHPHGDAAVYDAIVRMAQDFSLRYPLVDGQGNFGSVDGDAPAAMRYTEVRMSSPAQELLADIDRETVDFGANYDESLQEPLVLPARIPNLLINGASGIAVGMATNAPPHNLGEVVDALICLIDNPDAGIEELQQHIQGPDFPTGGFICGQAGILEAYRTGRGIIQLRAKALIEQPKGNNRERLVLVQLPYQVNKARLIEQIAELVKGKKIEGIADIRDESDRQGMRVVIELRRDESAQVVLNQLYKHTQMATTFGIIFLALVDNQPRILNLKELLSCFIEHRREIVTRRIRYDLRKARDRAHILEGLHCALEHLEEVIQMIRGSASPQVASQRLMERLGLTEAQVKAILEMRLQRLTSLEQEKIRSELSDTHKTIAELTTILESEAQVRGVIKQELVEIRARYADDRRSEIIDEPDEIGLESLIREEEMVVTISHSGYIKRNALSLYRSQHRGGKGIKAMETKADDFVEQLFVSSTHHYLLFFTNLGRVYWLKVHEIPQAGRAAKGKAIVNLLDLKEGERLTAALPVQGFAPGHFLVMATRQGMIKKTSLQAYSHPRAGGIIAITLNEQDELIAVCQTDGHREIFMGTRKGMAIRFPEHQVREIGRTGQGVRGIQLEAGDQVIDMGVVSPAAILLTVTEHGYGKRTRLEDYRLQHRGGKGLINIRTAGRNGAVVGIKQVIDDDELMLITQQGQLLWLKVAEVKIIGRHTQGVRLIHIDAEDRVMGVAALKDRRADEMQEER